MGATAEKLRAGEPVTVCYFGGSITEGAWASDQESTSWRALTTGWLRRRHPRSVITEVNAAIGGTGSDLGAFRCSRDVLVYRPDMVFIEFAVNDIHAKPERIVRSMEGIVRQIKRTDALTDILFVYTATKDIAGTQGESGCPFTAKFHDQVADFYGIPRIRAGKRLCDAVAGGVGTWETLTKDGVHPLDAGYALYADAVTAFLDEYLKRQQPVPAALPASPLSAKPLEYATLLDAWAYAMEGWERSAESLAGKYPHVLECGIPETELIIPFRGSAIGVYWLVAPDSGDIAWSVDGTTHGRASSWDEWALQFTRANYRIFCDDLADGDHMLRIRVLPEHAPGSKGCRVRIGAFLAEQSD